VSKIDTKPKREAGNRSTEAAVTLPYFIGSSQASVTALSMRCRSTLLHLGQLKVRKSWPNALGSIALSFIGELQAMQHGPWFCASSIGRSPIYAKAASVRRASRAGTRIYSFAEEAEADCDAGMRFPFRWAGALHSQSPMDAEAGR
jgi:hypothetical protein